MVNFNQFLKQAQTMQKKMQELKDQLAHAEYEGKAGGELVKLILTGENQLKSIALDPSILKEEDKELVEDLIVAAFNDARKKVENDSQEQFSSSFGGMGLPPGIKMPF